MNAFHERHAFWQAKEQEPWSKGKSERRQILSALKEIPRMSLDQAVNLMAFGTLEVPSDLEVVGAPLEEIARRRQAGRSVAWRFHCARADTRNSCVMGAYSLSSLRPEER
jgi:hypothetical protein